MVNISCCRCFVVFALNDSQFASLKSTGDFFYCPAGHEQHFTGKKEQTEIEQLKERIERLKRELDDAHKMMCPWCCKQVTVWNLYSHARRVHDLPGVAEVRKRAKHKPKFLLAKNPS